MDTSEKNYFVLEWTIKNFSCWNNGLHDKVITSTKTCTVPKWWFELYPRGLSGNDEHLVVLLHHCDFWTFLGDLSFISSDGSLLCTQQVDSKEDVTILELPPGPKFEEVVAQIRKKEALHEDRLTLRWRQSNTDVEMVEYLCTAIDAFDVNFKISSKVLDYLSSTITTLSWLNYTDDEEEMNVMKLSYGEDRSDRSKIVLTLNSFDHKKNVIVRTRMAVLNNEDVMRTEEKEHLFRDGNVWVFCDSLTREAMSKEGFSVNLYLKIIPSRKYKYCVSFRPKYPEDIHILPARSFKPLAEASVTVLTKELMCLYKDQDFADFQLRCGDVSIPVHKSILSARSPVFKTMLSCDMKEAASSSMDIEDIDPSTLGLFLTYLYTGAVEDLQGESALKLYYAADKYQVPSLKSECVSVLCSSVSISNVCDILSLADKHQDDQLTSAAHEFFLNNFSEVLASEEWKSFMRSEPMLALETVTHFGEKKYVKRSVT